ncbi:Cation-independent mannose-6-phosphate receptor [Allomyces javanicus]|nr:Cation-independent mannose-6-phosphate receptor [Allomyces javanicus]
MDVEWPGMNLGASAPADACRLSLADGRVVDLAPLRRTPVDYFSPARDSQNQFYYNLCGPLVDTTHCGSTAGACMTHRDDATWWRNIGDVSSAHLAEPRIPRDPHTVTYTMTAPSNVTCPGRSDPMAFELSAVCDTFNNGTKVADLAAFGVADVGRPAFTFEQEYCRYQFAIVSPHACPRTAGAPTVPAAPGCTLGAQYSLAKLRAPINYRVETELDTFWLNTCGALVDAQEELGGKGCPHGAAICARAKDTPAGQPIEFRSLGSNGELTVEEGVLTLTYHDGETCADGVPRTTIVRFPCSSDNPGTIRVVEGHATCGRTVFEWPSRAGCDMTAQGPGAGAVIGWIFLSGLIVYVVGRYLDNRFRKHMPGLEAIPHIDAMVDGIEWARAKWRGYGRIQI